jgi:hypothetical protein
MKPNILMPIMNFMTRYYHNLQHIPRIYSVVPHFFKIPILTLFTLVIVSVTSCEENPTSIGNKILPSGDFVEILSIDTLSAFSYTVYEDSVRSDNPSISYMGEIYDPYFGTTSTGFVSQVRMFPEWDDLPFTIDSVKLYLRLLQSKGGSSSASHTMRLSEIAEQIFTDKPYYSNILVPLTGYEVTNIQLPVLKPDTINNVVLKLPNSFGSYICRDTSMLFYSLEKPDFRSYFKGLYFQIDPSSDPLITSISLINESTQYYNNAIKIFMTNPVDGTKKSYTFALDAVNKNAAYNIYKHDLSTADPDKKVSHINDGYRDTLSYIQYLNGVYTKIEFPGLEVLKQNGNLKNIAINKARLIVPGYFDGTQYTPSKAPSQLLLRYKTNTGDRYIVPDFYVDKNTDQYQIFYDGRIDTTAREYSFNLPTFFQLYLEDATKGIKPELEMFQGAGTSNVILKTNLGKPPVRLEFTYTRF